MIQKVNWHSYSLSLLSDNKLIIRIILEDQSDNVINKHTFFTEYLLAAVIFVC